jgi:hypothetical protein
MTSESLSKRDQSQIDSLISLARNSNCSIKLDKLEYNSLDGSYTINQRSIGFCFLFHQEKSNSKFGFSIFKKDYALLRQIVQIQMILLITK